MRHAGLTIPGTLVPLLRHVLSYDHRQRPAVVGKHQVGLFSLRWERMPNLPAGSACPATMACKNDGGAPASIVTSRT